jgi:hypothetical protein
MIDSDRILIDQLKSLIRTKPCQYCSERVSAFHLLRTNKEVRYTVVTMTLRAMMWDGPTAHTSQWFYIGQCETCKKIHFQPAGVDSIPVDQDRTAIRQDDQEYLERLLKSTLISEVKDPSNSRI